MSDIIIRPAIESDAAAIARIYNHYILTSTATFDTAEKSPEDRVEWLRARTDAHPVFVAESGSEVIGWAALSPYRERPAWRHTCEVAVYLDHGTVGKGLGGRLLDRVIEAAREVGHHVLLSQIVGGNFASIKMTERAGFQRVGTIRECGRKFDRWLDVVIMELVLG